MKPAELLQMEISNSSSLVRMLHVQMASLPSFLEMSVPLRLDRTATSPGPLWYLSHFSIYSSKRRSQNTGFRVRTARCTVTASSSLRQSWPLRSAAPPAALLTHVPIRQLFCLCPRPDPHFRGLHPLPEGIIPPSGPLPQDPVPGAWVAPRSSVRVCGWVDLVG